MKLQRSKTSLIFAGLAMLVLIFDTKTVLSGLQNGIQISINCVFPSLFPFIFISAFMNSNLLSWQIPAMRPVGKLCKIPIGSESLLLLGLLGGYPVGAQIISDNYRNGHVDRSTAQRMLGFCNNAGPSFLFGILSPMFQNSAAPYILWIIHLLSAIIVGALLPFGDRTTYSARSAEAITLTRALESAVRIIVNICGWVILFRGLITVCEKWFLRRLPTAFTVIFIGILELSNGCISLTQINPEHLRFIICSCMLAAGGACVAMQCKSIVGTLGLGMYIPGKILQTSTSLILSVMVSFILYRIERPSIRLLLPLSLISIVVMAAICLFFYFSKKKDRFLKRNVV